MRQAYELSCTFLNRTPKALIHDNKPIHEEKSLREAIEPRTHMIAATPARPENKAVIEGEFGKDTQKRCWYQCFQYGSLHDYVAEVGDVD